MEAATRSFPDLLAGEVRAKRDLADMAGVSERVVRFVEQGKPSVQLDSLLAVLDTLGLQLHVVTRTGRAHSGGAGG